MCAGSVPPTRATMRTSPAPASRPLEDAILRTLLYADVFDFPLSASEIHRFLVGEAASVDQVRSALEDGGLTSVIEAEPPYYFVAGKAYCAHVRRHYLSELQRKWARAASYARLLQCVPFVRGAFVTGSLAAGNVDGHSDVDFLLIVQSGRCLLVHAWIKLLVRRGLGGAARLVAGDYFDWMCPNFILAEDELELPRKDLYTAWETAQAVPILGEAACRRFLAANGWIRAFLPNSLDQVRCPPSAGRASDGGLTAPGWGERAMGRGAELVFAGPVAAGMEHMLRSWLRRRYAARRRPDVPVATVPSAPLSRSELQRSPSRWQLFPATTRFRILEAYQYRLRAFGLESSEMTEVELAASAA